MTFLGRPNPDKFSLKLCFLKCVKMCPQMRNAINGIPLPWVEKLSPLYHLGETILKL